MNDDWEVLATLHESEADQRESLMQVFKNTFGDDWSFKWSTR
jgi:hypothetical protein